MYYTNRYNCATREHIVAYSLLFWHTPHFSLRRIHNPQAHLIAYYKCVYEAKISASCERFNALYASRPSAGEPEPTGQSANARLLTSARKRASPTIVTSQIDHNLLRLGFMPGGGRIECLCHCEVSSLVDALSDALSRAGGFQKSYL